jgi:hypothetical protein
MVCSKCKLDLLEDDFAIDKSKKSGHSHRCKTCQKKLSKSHYYKNKDKYRNNAGKRRLELRKWFLEYKSQYKCEHCGFDNPNALDFHHKDKKDKKGKVGELLSYTKNKAKVIEEIKKCIALCANCHRILHAKEYDNLDQ